MKEKLKKSFPLNVAVVFALCMLLYILFFASLHCVTHHGEEVAMPDVRGKRIDSALAQLKALDFEILIDSTYEPTSRPLSILKQLPDTGSFVKKGRTVFLTVNMVTPPMIPMPAIKDLSYRSAAMMLRNNKLLVGDTTYRPDIAAGAVLDALYNGTHIDANTKIPQGSKIDLIIGNGLGNTEWDVPSVTNMSVDEAMVYLNQFNLQPVLVTPNAQAEISDTPSAIITDQEPRAYNDAGVKNRIKMGDFITLKIMQHPSPEDIHQSEGNIAPDANVNDDNPKKHK